MLGRVARRAHERPASPRLPPDLPVQRDVDLVAGSEVTGVTLQGDYARAELDGLVVEDAHLVRSSFTGADLSRLSLLDVLVEGSDFSGANLEEASLRRVTFKECRMSGARLPRAQLQDVTFSDVRLDDVNFRMSKGARVLFDHVNLTRGDFYAAHLTSTCFFDCDLTGADVTQAKFPGSRLHGSTLLELKGAESLRDVVIDSTQVLPLAVGVFAGLKIRVEDERDAPDP
jgi:uncharacterized protein YjbI with pentapeptide repeats